MLRGISRPLKHSTAFRRFASTHLTDRIQITTLANGFRVFSDSTPGFFSCLGVFVNSGSRSETAFGSTGLTHINSRLAYKSTESQSTQQMLEKLRQVGGIYDCVYDREYVAYNASVMNNPADIEQMFGLLSDTIRNPQITDAEVEEVKGIADYELQTVSLNPEQILPEVSFIAAYNGQTLGAPLLCPPESLHGVDRATIMAYRELFFTPHNLIAGFSGVEHDVAVKLAEKYFGDMTSEVQTPSKGVARYTGGSISLPTPQLYGRDEEKTFLRLSFESVPASSDELYAAAVLQSLIGQARSFSAGGPGKGLYSRAMRDVLNGNGYMDFFSADGFVFSDSGLFSVTAACLPHPKIMAQLPSIICEQISNTFMARGVKALTRTEVERAKNQLKSHVMIALENKPIQLEECFKRIVQFDSEAGRKFVADADYCHMIENVTMEDVKSVAEKIFTGKAGKGSGKVTVAIQGDAEAVGDVGTVVKKYGLGN
ncbi:hypothetical protein BABINDRAFT_160683 [Babjeviella inositovora NRRL Y-12698]|uniref:Peptidase M16 N-terminal domain-containing protein n=1 Tax=Babjeviella inositovora NRRL Y-12698 TaxID=984486 RepID=A0A1E3QUT4_9ASCO|nr:uncharacterized protein BABINDRAFT_160683 [Babjeviella inositovora NRRL Y-12698]ODQ81324.1 hypothetical protein BABINDRAFT_160683 [Babjeviella inositovora NRRL Y-12698]